MSKIFHLSAILIGFTLSGCAAAQDDADDTLDERGDVEEALIAGRRVDTDEIVRLLTANGIPQSVIPELVCTAKYESSFYEGASNRNRNGSMDRGLFQVNSIHLGSVSACPDKDEAKSLFNAATNVKCAAAIYRMQGLNAWYGYRAHRRTCDSYVLP
jgi:hypothetical protein